MLFEYSYYLVAQSSLGEMHKKDLFVDTVRLMWAILWQDHGHKVEVNIILKFLIYLHCHALLPWKHWAKLWYEK